MALVTVIEDLYPRTTWLPLDGSFLQKPILEEIIGAVQDLYDQMIAITGTEIELALPDYPADFQVDYASATPFVLIYDTLHIARQRLYSLVDTRWGLRDPGDPYYVDGTRWSFRDYGCPIRNDTHVALIGTNFPSYPHSWKTQVATFRSAIEAVTEIWGRAHQRTFSMTLTPEVSVSKYEVLKRVLADDSQQDSERGNYYLNGNYYPWDPQTVWCYPVADPDVWGFPGLYGDLALTHEYWQEVLLPFVYARNHTSSGLMPWNSPGTITRDGQHITDRDPNYYHTAFLAEYGDMWEDDKWWAVAWDLVPKCRVHLSIELEVTSTSEDLLPFAEAPGSFSVTPDLTVAATRDFTSGDCFPSVAAFTGIAGYTVTVPDWDVTFPANTTEGTPVAGHIEIHLDDDFPEDNATPCNVYEDAHGVLRISKHKTVPARPTNELGPPPDYEENYYAWVWIVGRRFDVTVEALPSVSIRADVDWNGELRNWEKYDSEHGWQPL